MTEQASGGEKKKRQRRVVPEGQSAYKIDVTTHTTYIFHARSPEEAQESARKVGASGKSGVKVAYRSPIRVEVGKAALFTD